MPILLDEPELKTGSEEQIPLPEYYEVIDGEIVEVPPMSDFANAVANRLNRAVTIYLLSNDIGETGIELLFRIPKRKDKGRNRRPDWSYVSYERWPKDRLYSYRGNSRDVVPEIAVEVISPGDTVELLNEKVREYLQGGVRLVWVIHCLTQEIHAYQPGSASIRIFFATDELEAGDILTGFRTSVAALFPPLEQTSTATDDD